MRVSHIAGFSGSGKTMALMKIFDELMRRGHRVSIIVNDVGYINADAKFFESRGIEANEVSGGCACCQLAGSFAETLSMLHDTLSPDIVIVEPSGAAIPWGLRRATGCCAGKGREVEVAPVITLVDATRIDMLLRAVRRLLETQIREADACFVSKVDSADPSSIKKTEDLIKNINPEAETAHISSETGEGISYACDIIELHAPFCFNEAFEMEVLRKHYGGV